MSTSTLDCDHCGGTACTSFANGCFEEGMSDRCETCGFPGHVVVDGDDEDPDENPVHWVESSRDGARCERRDCEDCK